MVAVLEERPPYVTFERASTEDRAASLQAGRTIYRDQDLAWITPMGSKDRIPRIVTDWFAALEQQVREGRFNASWLQDYRKAYEYFKSGQEAPVNGIPLDQWSACSPAMRRNLLAVGVRSVEDVAALNEEGIRRVGMGAQNLKMQAARWLETADKASSAAQLADMEQRLNTALRTIANMQETHEAAMAELRGQRPSSPDEEIAVKL